VEVKNRKKEEKNSQLKKKIIKTKENFKNKVSLQVGVVDGRIMTLSK
jgi:hypothetical protein